MTTKTTGKEEVCDETCDCHDELTIVGNEVYTNTNGGAGPSDRMKALIEMKNLKTKGGIKSK
jgi:hypothetical protein